MHINTNVTRTFHNLGSMITEWAIQNTEEEEEKLQQQQATNYKAFN